MRFEPLPAGAGQPALGAIFGAVLLSAGGLAALWVRLALPLPVCWLRAWTGIPCPTCGSTRLVRALLAGDVVAALAANPLVFAGLVALAAWAVVSACRLALGLPARRIVCSAGERLALRVGVVVTGVAGWLYLLVRA